MADQNKVVDNLAQVYEVLVPDQKTMEKMPPEAQNAIHSMAHFTAGVMTGAKITGDQLRDLASGLSDKKTSETPAAQPEPVKNPRAQTG